VISFTYEEPLELERALELLAEHGDEARVIAGGTALINLMKQRLVQPSSLVSLRRIAELEGIRRNGELRIGALSTHRAVETSPLVEAHAPMLTEMFHHVASVRVRNIATLGGALAHADPNQDAPPALIAVDARVRVRSARAEREIPIDEFFSGYYETVLDPDEVVMEVVVPQQPAASGAAFLKFLPQTQDDYATVSAAVRLTLEGGRIVGARVAVGSAGPTAIRLHNVEAALTGQAPQPSVFRDAASLAADAVDPTSDFRGSAAYKREMSTVFVRRALEQAAQRAQRSAT
jgi:aerobic carbon-monoxide dehydrogenase medium subunit